MRTQTTRPNPGRKKQAGGHGYERGRSPEGGARHRHRASWSTAMIWCCRRPWRRPLPSSTCCHATKPTSWRCSVPREDGWTGEDWHDFFEERAAIGEFDGGLTRVQAEAQAFACCVVEWLNRNFVGSSPGCCLACNGADLAHDRLLPHGIEPSGHAWLHDTVGPLGTPRGRPTPSRRSRRWGSHSPGKLARRFREKRRRMMGGWGSGRPSGTGRDVVESCRSLDVNRLHRTDCLRPGWSGGWQWTAGR